MCVCVCMCVVGRGGWISKPNVRVLMRDEKEGRKKQARSNKQGKETAHPR